MQSPQYRYTHDSAYRQIVDTMEYLIHSAQLTPSEIREAAVLASINYESKRIRHFHIPLTPELHAYLRELNVMVEGVVQEMAT